MIQDLIVSFKENIKGKTTNPFFGTLIIVWIFHNWRLMYSLFNFESSSDLKTRLIFLSDYLDAENFLPDLLLCILLTIIVLISTYILLNLSRLIVNFFEKIVTPIVYKLTDKSSIVLKKDYDNLISDRERVEKKFEMERESRLKLQDEYERLEVRLGQALQTKSNKSNSETTLKKGSKDENLMRLINDRQRLDSFKKMVDVVLNKRPVQDSDMTDLMLRLNLVEKGNAGFNDDFSYTLTEDGKRLRELLIENDSM